MKKDNIEVLYNSKIMEVYGNEKTGMSGAKIYNTIKDKIGDVFSNILKTSCFNIYVRHHTYVEHG